MSKLIPNFLIAELNYEQNYVPENSTVKVLFGRTGEEKKPYSLFIIAQKCISPMQYPKETFELVYQFMRQFNIDIEQVNMYLDYEEVHGASKGALTLWNVTHYNGTFQDDSLIDVLHKALPKPVQELRDLYYFSFVYKDITDELGKDLIYYKRNNIYE